jgi:ankyrin repeat protein
MADVLKCKNTVILDKRLLIRDFKSDEVRIKELTPLMIACIMGNMETVKNIVKVAKEQLTEEDFSLFINVKVERAQGGNNALLYAIGGQNTNSYLLVYFLIVEAGANCNLSNDFDRNSLLIAARRNQLNVVELLLQNKVDINFCDANGCNALHVVCTNGFIECADMLLSYWYKQRKSDR